MLHFPQGGLKSYCGDTSTSRSGLSSGGEIGHQLCEKFETGKLDGVNLQSTAADEAQNAGDALWRLDAAGATPKYTQSEGQKANANDEGGELYLRKREFLLFLPDVDDRGDKAGQQAHYARVLISSERGRRRALGCAAHLRSRFAVRTDALA